MGQFPKRAQWLSSESQADRHWAGVHSSSFPSESALAPLSQKLSTRSGADRSWEKSATKAAHISVEVDPPQFLQPK